MPLKFMFAKESELYPKIERYFKKKGYLVKGEVSGCDLVAYQEKTESLLIVELKLSFNTKLLYQAVRRLSITDQVYVAIPALQGRRKAREWNMIRSLCRRLHIGLLFVSSQKVKLAIEPAPFHKVHNAAKKRQILKEFHGRKVASNTGGVNATKIQTAYLEASIQIAVMLQKYKKAGAAFLRKQGCPENTYRILYNNFHGWFVRKETGVYALRRGQQKKIAKAYPVIWEFYEKQIQNS